MDCPDKWTEDNEPLCGDCSEKYYFALQRNLLIEKVSDLTKEQRKLISSKLRDIKCFIRTMHYIKNTELTGGVKIVSNILATTLVIIFLFGFSQLYDLTPKGIGLLGELILGLVGLALFCGLAMALLTFYTKLNWLLKLHQLKKENGWSDNKYD